MSTRIRGRFEILVPLGSGYLKLQSDPKRSVEFPEIAKAVREFLDQVERALATTTSTKLKQRDAHR